jgi:hypothetical protein
MRRVRQSSLAYPSRFQFFLKETLATVSDKTDGSKGQETMQRAKRGHRQIGFFPHLTFLLKYDKV